MTKDIFDKYPILFQDVYCGFDVGDGWLPLIDKLCSELISLKLDIKVAQVKEKYGTLRFYVDYGKEVGETEWKLVETVIDKYEHLSETTCEACGNLGKLRGGGWIKTRCDQCEMVENKIL